MWPLRVALGIMGFLLALLWWPYQPQALLESSVNFLNLISYSAAGVSAWLLVRFRKPYVVLSIALLSGPFLILISSGQWFASLWSMLIFLVLIITLERSILFPRYQINPQLFNTRENLTHLVVELALYPAFWPALMLGAYAYWSGQGVYDALTFVFVSWEILLLTLVVAVAGAARSGHMLYRWQELLTNIVLSLLLWIVVHRLGGTKILPNQIIFLPFIIWAAVRLGTFGVAVLAFLSMLLPMLLPMAEATSRHLLGVAILSLDTMMTLIFTLIGLFWSLLLDREQKSRDELRDYQLRFEALLNNSPNMMTIRDMNGVYVQVNQAFARSLQLQPHEVIGRSIHDLFPLDEVNNILEADRNMLATKKPIQSEDALTFFDKTLIVLSTRFPLLNAQQKVIGICVVDTDVTDSRLKEVAKRETEARYKALVEQSLVGIYIIQNDTLVYANPKLADMLGYSQDELFGKSIYDVLDPKEVPRLKSILQKRFSEKIKAMHYVTRILSQDGRVIDVDIHSSLFEYRNHQALIGVIVDVSDRVAADEQLRLSAKVFENSTEAILITDASPRILAANEAYRDLMGYDSKESIVGQPVPKLADISSDDGRAMRSALESEGHWRGELWIERNNGERFPIDLSVAVVNDQHGVLNNYVVVFSDITVRHQSEERLKFLANHDPLTRLPNRSYLTYCIEEAIIAADPERDRLAVMFIDLDRFKLINDSLGHQAGDQLLREIAERLNKIVANRGMIARLGGDEFTLFVSHHVQEEFLGQLAQEVLTELSRPMVIEGHEVFVTGSVGISLYPSDALDANGLLKNADVAMYRAKENGKNNYQFFDEAMNAQTFERLLMENQLRSALEKEEFEIYFQPKVHAHSLRICGVECLLRWKHPERGYISPALFIPLAEDTGLIKPIGLWVLREACRRFMQLKEDGLNLEHISVNLSARQFDQQGLINTIQNVFDETGIAPNELELEITESTIMRHPLEAEGILLGLHALGIRLAIDDFGTGYSSLAYLKRFPIHTLKVDKSFVDGLPKDVKNIAIIDAVLAMARGLGYDVVAEGVESIEQAQCLQQRGCALIQGYVFAKPMDFETLKAYLMSWKSEHWIQKLHEKSHS